jgi:hypothetical protein
MAWRRRAICLGLLVLGTLGLIWASGVAFWLALGMVAVGLLGVLLPRAGAERFVRIAMVAASVFAGLALLESALRVRRHPRHRSVHLARRDPPDRRQRNAPRGAASAEGSHPFQDRRGRR